jgi:uncharacterized membrane protein
MHGDIGSGTMMLGMWLVWLIPFVLVGGAAWFGIRSHRSETTALELLKQKYARGEITRDQYLEARQDLA